MAGSGQARNLTPIKSSAARSLRHLHPSGMEVLKQGVPDDPMETLKQVYDYNQSEECLFQFESTEGQVIWQF